MRHAIRHRLRRRIIVAMLADVRRDGVRPTPIPIPCPIRISLSMAGRRARGKDVGGKTSQLSLDRDGNVWVAERGGGNPPARAARSAYPRI